MLLTLAGLWQQTGAPGDGLAGQDCSRGEPEAGALPDAGHQAAAHLHRGGAGGLAEGGQEAPHVVHLLHLPAVLQAVHHPGPGAGLLALHVGVHRETDPVPGARGHGEPDGVPGPVRQGGAHQLRPAEAASRHRQLQLAGGEGEAERGLGVALADQLAGGAAGAEGEAQEVAGLEGEGRGEGDEGGAAAEQRLGLGGGGAGEADGRALAVEDSRQQSNE